MVGVLSFQQLDSALMGGNTGSGLRFKKLFIGVLRKEKEKKNDNQYKLKKAMAIAIGLTSPLVN